MQIVKLLVLASAALTAAAPTPVEDRDLGGSKTFHELEARQTQTGCSGNASYYFCSGKSIRQCSNGGSRLVANCASSCQYVNGQPFCF
jgi:hypothetical protein